MANWAFRASHMVAKLGEIHAPTGIRLSGALGWWLGPRAGPRRCPTPEMVQKIWKERSPEEVERLRREMARQEFRNRTLRRIFRTRGVAAVAERVSVEAAPLQEVLASGRGAIAVAWHMGPSRAHSLALKSLGYPVLYATFAGPAGEETLEGLPYFELKGGAFYASFLKSAVDRLREGGIVGMALDSNFGATEPMSFLGGTLPTPRGAAALARITGAPVLPTTSRWSRRGARLEVEFHPALPEPDIDRRDRDGWERAMMESALRFFEDWLRAHPETVRLKELRRYVRDPAVSSAQTR